MEREQAHRSASNIATSDGLLVRMHIGNLHLTDAEEPNHLALRDIIAQANTHLAGYIDFAVLPGSNADDGKLRPNRNGRRW